MIEKEVGYTTWNSMMGRCYRPTTKAGRDTYKDCYVCDDWLDFSTFQLWYIKHYRDGYEIDKDLAVVGNRCYSEERCYFVPPKLNTLIMPKAKGYSKKRNRYAARVTQGHTTYNLGTFDTEEEARKMYITNKHLVIHYELPKYIGLINAELLTILINRYKL